MFRKIKKGSFKMIKVIDLMDSSRAFEFEEEKEFTEWTNELAHSFDDDEDFLRSFNFSDVEQCKEYLDVMGYEVK